MLRVSILVAPPVALLILLALVGLGVATAVVAGLVAGYAVGALGGGGIRRMERRYAVVLARRCPRSLRPGRYAFDPVVVPLDEARVDQLIRDGIAVPSSSASPGR